MQLSDADVLKRTIMSAVACLERHPEIRRGGGGRDLFIGYLCGAGMVDGDDYERLKAALEAPSAAE